MVCSSGFLRGNIINPSSSLYLFIQFFFLSPPRQKQGFVHSVQFVHLFLNALNGGSGIIRGFNLLYRKFILYFPRKPSQPAAPPGLFPSDTLFAAHWIRFQSLFSIFHDPTLNLPLPLKTPYSSPAKFAKFFPRGPPLNYGIYLYNFLFPYYCKKPADKKFWRKIFRNYFRILPLRRLLTFSRFGKLRILRGQSHLIPHEYSNLTDLQGNWINRNLLQP